MRRTSGRTAAAPKSLLPSWVGPVPGRHARGHHLRVLNLQGRDDPVLLPAGRGVAGAGGGVGIPAAPPPPPGYSVGGSATGQTGGPNDGVCPKMRIIDCACAARRVRADF